MACCGGHAPEQPMLEPPNFLVACDQGSLTYALSFFSPVALELRDPDSGGTPLHFAAGSGHDHIVRFLLDRGANVHATNKNGETPLFWAALKGHLSCMAALLDHHADPLARDVKGCTAHFAAARNGQFAAVVLLMEAAPLPNPAAVDPAGHTLLGWATYRGNLALVRYLKEMHNVPCDTFDENRRSPLHWAAREGHTDVAVYLMAAGLSPTAKDSSEMSPLMYAATRNHPETEAALLSRRTTPIDHCIGTVQAIARNRYQFLSALLAVVIVVASYYLLRTLLPPFMFAGCMIALTSRRMLLSSGRKMPVTGSRPEMTMQELMDTPGALMETVQGPWYTRRRDCGTMVAWIALLGVQLYTIHRVELDLSSTLIHLLLFSFLLCGFIAKWKSFADVVSRGALADFPLFAAIRSRNFRDAAQLESVLSEKHLVRVPLRAFECREIDSLVKRLEGWTQWFDCPVSNANKRWYLGALLSMGLLQMAVFIAAWGTYAAACPADRSPSQSWLRTIFSLAMQGTPCPMKDSVLAGTPLFPEQASTASNDFTTVVSRLLPGVASGDAVVLLYLSVALFLAAVLPAVDLLRAAAQGVTQMELRQNSKAPCSSGGLTSIVRRSGANSEVVFSEGSASLNLMLFLTGRDGARWEGVQALPPAPAAATEERVAAGFLHRLSDNIRSLQKGNKHKD